MSAFPICVGGSSPRVRGTASVTNYGLVAVRFIPACAGNRYLPVQWLFTVAVHPRVCGEQIFDRKTFSYISGSSPRVRGTAGSSSVAGSFTRFIPACAGNRPLPANPGSPASVHPRVCGEQDRSVFLGVLERGSSPRVRGTDGPAADRGRAWRFIPACAGNSIRPGLSVLSVSVHPRMCGEQELTRLSATLDGGSSPRVRGTAQ